MNELGLTRRTVHETEYCRVVAAYVKLILVLVVVLVDAPIVAHLENRDKEESSQEAEKPHVDDRD